VFRCVAGAAAKAATDDEAKAQADAAVEDAAAIGRRMQRVHL